MDELLNLYIDLNYSQELGYELLRAFQLFDNFNYKDGYEKMISAVMDVDNRDKAEVSDFIVSCVREGQDYIFNAHALKISEDSTIQDRNELLLGLALFMKMEDYEPIITVLYSDAEDMEKFSSIMTDICMLEEIKIYDMVIDFDPIILETMKKYAEGRTVEEESMELGRSSSNCVKSIRDFKEVFGEEALGVQMLKSGAVAGQLFNSYYKFTKDSIVDSNNLENTAKNILSLLLLSSNGNNAPIITYKKNIDKIIDDLETIQKLEPIILKMYSELENYRRARNEQK